MIIKRYSLLIGIVLLALLPACTPLGYTKQLMNYPDEWPQSGMPRLEVLQILGPGISNYDRRDSEWREIMMWKWTDLKMAPIGYVALVGLIATASGTSGSTETRHRLYVEFNRSGLVVSRYWTHEEADYNGWGRVIWRPVERRP